MNNVKTYLHAEFYCRRRISTRLLLLLLIFSPLIYSIDGDPYREYELIGVALTFLIIAIPKITGQKFLFKSGLNFMLAIVLLIGVQPFFLEAVRLNDSLKFIIVLLASFLPMLYFSKPNPHRAEVNIFFIVNSLKALFAISVISLFISYFFGLGEVYIEGSKRAFAWMGDSFSPVIIFFLYYYYFKKSALGIFLSIACILFIMQAKMAIIMAVFGLLFFTYLFGNRSKKLLVGIFIAFGILTLPFLLDLASKNIHNFDYSFNNRLLSFASAWDFFISSPWLGVGANKTLALLIDGFDVSGLSNFDSGKPFYEFVQIHNSFLRVLAELGLLGCLFFLAFCLKILQQSLNVLKLAQNMPHNEMRTIMMACSLWIISFVLTYQTTGWFEPGHPQLSWLICIFTLMSFVTQPQSVN